MKVRSLKWCLLLYLGTLLSTVAGFANFLRSELQAWGQAPSSAVLQPEKKQRTFTILHTNDLHASFIGMGPAADYTPFTLNDDATRGGWARLGALIANRKEARKGQGPVLVLDAGDYSMGTPFSAATRETGCELQLMSLMHYDATTLGNHEFDLGPEGLGKSIGVASKAGRIPAVLASNSSFPKNDATLADLQLLAKEGVIRRHVVIERGGMRFGLFGVLGKEAVIYTNGGATKFADPIETAKEMVKFLRDTEKVDVVIALSHSGVEKGKDGHYTEGDDVRLARAGSESGANRDVRSRAMLREFLAVGNAAEPGVGRTAIPGFLGFAGFQVAPAGELGL